MSAAILLARVRGHGVELRAVADTLQCRPKDALPPTIVADLRRHRRAILALLAADDPAVAARVMAMRARHPPPWRATPFLTVRDVPRGTPGCRSCGEPPAPLADGLAVRCHPCVLAAFLVLGDDPRADEATPKQVEFDAKRSVS